MNMDLHEAARLGDLAALEEGLRRASEPGAKNQNGFTLLHCAAVACSRVDEKTAIALVRRLIDAGCPVNESSDDGRTVLFLAAEFSNWVEPLKLLIAAGANPNVRDSKGNHIVTNANAKEVQKFLSEITGHPIPPPRVEFPSEKLSAAEWRQAKHKLDPVFDGLARAGLVVLQDAGTTQEDGFADCSQAFREKGGLAAGLIGFCFYTRQDLNRAKRTSQLSLAFWGAPDGNDDAMERVGWQVTEAFRKAGFTVGWDGTPRIRPTIFLKTAKAAK